MQSEHANAVRRNPRTASEGYTDLRANHQVKPDTRRFAGIFPLDVSDAASVNCDGDATHEEIDSINSDSPSRWEFVSVPDDKDAFTSQMASAASTDGSSTPSEAQRIVTCYRAVHGNDHAPESTTTEIREKGLPQIPDDQRSMYTLAVPGDIQSTMDMMWRPKPKVHMHRTDQRALVQAQSQAIAMMHGAGLKPTNKIQCRRRGCADILPDVEALKYHLHIHNIADMATSWKDASPSGAHKPSLVECSASNSKTTKSSHSRSKSSFGTLQSCSTTYSPLGKLSGGSFLPSLFSPRESAPEIQHVPNLTTVAKALIPDHSPNQPGPPLSVRNEIPSAHSSTHSRGRRTRKESKVVSVDTECSPSIAILLSPPSSPAVRGRLKLTPHTNRPKLPMHNPAMGGENGDRDRVPNGNVQQVSEKFARARSPLRALSPMRAMSPIRDGIRRVLSIGQSVDSTDE